MLLTSFALATEVSILPLDTTFELTYCYKNDGNYEIIPFSMMNNTILNNYKTEVGQYMVHDNNGLTLGATSSSFKTVIDNTGMYFKQYIAVL